MPDSKVAKTYVRPDNTIVLTCTHCGIQKVVLADLFIGRKHKLKVKCRCEKVFIVNLEFRAKIRKKVNLRGTYINHSQKDKMGNIIIKDISVVGLAFSNLDGQIFNMGDELSLEFTLDDEHETKIEKEVIVSIIHQISIGCEFINSDDFLGSQLSHYIKSTLL
ncbi:PilZ domain-containing protein [Thermodesulfobacteriota bacterium]